MSEKSRVFRLGNGVHDDYLTAMRRGFREDECEKGMVKLSKRLAKDLHEKNISIRNAMFVLKKTGGNSRPKMSDSEMYQLWKEVVMKEKKERDKEKEKERDRYVEYIEYKERK